MHSQEEGRLLVVLMRPPPPQYWSKLRERGQLGGSTGWCTGGRGRPRGGFPKSEGLRATHLKSTNGLMNRKKKHTLKQWGAVGAMQKKEGGRWCHAPKPVSLETGGGGIINTTPPPPIALLPIKAMFVDPNQPQKSPRRGCWIKARQAYIEEDATYPPNLAFLGPFAYPTPRG